MKVYKSFSPSTLLKQKAWKGELKYFLGNQSV